jgi:hypothetical protein
MHKFYQRGLAQEHANGNLNEAHQLYSQAANGKGANPPRRLRRKLSHQTEAADTYARVMRAYPEQRAKPPSLRA